jgi:hypothetical protein
MDELSYRRGSGLERDEEGKMTWITCPECGARIGIVISIGRPEPSVKPLEEAERPTSISERLSSMGVDVSLLEIEEREGVTVITPKRFLGDLWGSINEAIKGMGGTWVREGKQSRWEISRSSSY